MFFLFVIVVVVVLHGLKMCMLFWGYATIIILQFFALFQFSFYVWHDDMGSLRAQLSLQFYTKPFETLQVFFFFFFMVWRSACGFGNFINFYFHFSTLFSGPISIGIDTLWAQVILQFSTDRF